MPQNIGMNHKIFAIEIKNNLIKTAFVEKSKKEIPTINFNSIKIKSKEGLIEMLIYLANKYNLKKSHLINISLGCQNFITRDVKLPAANPEELRAMLDFQISRLSPFSKEEIVYNYIESFLDKAGFKQLLVPILQKQSAEHLEALLKESGIKPSGFYFGAEAILSAFDYFKKSSKELEQLRNYILVDIDSSDTTVLAVYQDNLVFIRNISLGAGEVRATSTNFKNELKNTISILNAKFPELAFENVIITGASLDEETKDRLKELLTKSVRFFSFLSLCQQECNLNFESDDARNNSSNLSLYGLLLNNLQLKFSLSRRFDRAKAINFKNLIFSKVNFLAAGFLTVCFMLFLVNFYAKKQELYKLERRIGNIESETLGVKESFLISQLRKEDLVDILVELYNILPENILLSSLSYNYNQQLVIKGKAHNMGEINNFLLVLKNSRYLKNAQLKYASKNKTDRGQAANFEINFYPNKNDLK